MKRGSTRHARTPSSTGSAELVAQPRIPGYQYEVQPMAPRPEYGPTARISDATRSTAVNLRRSMDTACRQPDGSWQLINDNR